MTDSLRLNATVGPAISDDLAALLDLDPADRAQAEILMAAAASPEVQAALGLLRMRLGAFPAHPPEDRSAPEVWICALLLFAPELAAWHADRSVDAAITAATLADFGRQFRLHRVTHGVFGLETWGWLTWHCGGGLYQLGRLHFLLRRLSSGEPLPPGADDGNWVLDVHIPPIGPLLPELVDDAFRQAAAFFPAHFPGRPASAVVCFSWLLDPFLAEHLPAGNIAQFQQCFRPYGAAESRPQDALYFVFRTREQDGLPRLPRRTSLQRLVLDRIASGGVWQACYGWRAR
jgi:hypothetical protein